MRANRAGLEGAAWHRFCTRSRSMAKKSKKQRARARKQAESAKVRLASPPPAPPIEEEHRASKRISLQVELHLASDSHFFSGLSGDISEGGVFVSTYRALAQGSLVDLEFSLPGADQPLHARGEVRWHRDATPHGPPPGVGISFDELSEDDRNAIHRFCTMRPPLYYDDVG